MMSSGKVAVVTGSNKGIGYGIVKGLCEKFDGVVYLTSRDIARGKEAVERLKQLGLEPLYHKLDVTDQSSIDTFKKFIETSHGGLDLLVNNAGVRLKVRSEISGGLGWVEPFGKSRKNPQSELFRVVNLCEAMFPLLLRNNARMVNISSLSGHLSKIPHGRGGEIGDSETGSNRCRREQTHGRVIRLAHERQVLVEGWGKQTYLVSKVGLTALTFIQQRLFDGETPYRNISVNAVHPGYVSTDLVDHKGPLTVEEGARVPLLVALESDCKGKYVWCDGREVDWYADVTPALS
ncbi:hypothetical protein JTB14_003776 [Gonioctena quinquepunctata]|nr:hypothetical protein JTB14_003776 [Gonioctena quinquepunctata]